MKDEYTPKDIKYDEIKHIFEKELRGTSLKQMEANKVILFPSQIFFIHPSCFRD